MKTDSKRVQASLAGDLLRAVVALNKTQGLYPAGHGNIRKAERSLAEVLHAVFHDPRDLLIGTSDGHLSVGGVAFVGTSVDAATLVEWLEGHRVEGFILKAGVRSGEVREFCEWLRSPPASSWSGERIQITRVRKARGAWDEGFGAYRAAVVALSEAYREVEAGRIPDPSRGLECVRTISGLIDEHPSLVSGLALIKDYDQYTFHHSINVCLVSLGLGKHLGLPPEVQESLGIGALFHDIGKTRTPPNVVRKPTRLSRDEWSLMWRHPEYGFEIVGEMAGLPVDTKRIVFEHHMHFGGGGYPERPAGYEVNPLSQLVAASDVYDAMTSHRSYSSPLPLPEAVACMRNLRGRTLNPQAVDALIAVVGEIPVGSVVRLGSGEVAVVVGDPGEDGRYLFRLVIAADGTRLAVSREGAPKRRGARDVIVRWMDPLLHGINPAEVLKLGA